MKEKFLALVNEVKATGIVAILSNTSNVDEFKEAWQKFADENPELFKKAFDWGTEFRETNAEAIFKVAEAVENPVEIAVTIVMVGNEISDGDIFDDYEDLMKALEEEGSDFANAIAEFINSDYICYITPKDLFPEDDEEDEESEDDDNQEDAEPEEGQEDADCGEESNAEEADSDDAECDATVVDEAEPGDDNYDGKEELCLGDPFDEDFDSIPGRE